MLSQELPNIEHAEDQSLKPQQETESGQKDAIRAKYSDDLSEQLNSSEENKEQEKSKMSFFLEGKSGNTETIYRTLVNHKVDPQSIPSFISDSSPYNRDSIVEALYNLGTREETLNAEYQGWENYANKLEGEN